MNLVKKKSIAVIGSGIAGLAAASRLAAQGFDVDVFEKNSYPGGKLSQIKLGEYQFDAGPSLFTQPNNLTELFQDCGEDMHQFFKYSSVELSCKYFFSNGQSINAWVNKEKFANEMEEKLGEDKENILKYLDRAKNAYQTIGELFTGKSLHRISTWMNKNALKALWNTRPSYLLNSMHQFNTANFKKPETIQLFNRFATYNGSNPYKAPAMLTMIPHLELNEGTFYPQGGMISITNAIYRLAQKKGVRFYFETPVQGLELPKNQKAKVLTQMGVRQYDLVVSNMDAYYTYKYLLKEDRKALNIGKQERSSSAFIFYWGIKKEFKQLELHNIFFSGDYREEFKHIFEKGSIYHDPTVYINITSKMESGQAPEGCENWFVMVNVPHDAGQDWDNLRTLCRKQTINKISGILGEDILPLIEEEDYLDPLRIDSRTGSYTGSLYGTSSNSKVAAFLRHPNFSSKYANLFFVGGSVHPGGGIPLCLRSARIAASMIS
jgi:phytoene desaturase